MGRVIMRLYDASWYSYGTPSPSHGAFRRHQLGVSMSVTTNVGKAFKQADCGTADSSAARTSGVRRL